MLVVRWTDVTGSWTLDIAVPIANHQKDFANWVQQQQHHPGILSSDHRLTVNLDEGPGLNTNLAAVLRLLAAWMRKSVGANSHCKNPGGKWLMEKIVPTHLESASAEGVQQPFEVKVLFFFLASLALVSPILL